MNKFSFSSSPAWSIAHRYRNENIGRDGAMPGPGAYTLSRSGKHETPAWKIGTSSRDGKKGSHAPGPGAYNVLKGNDAPKPTFGIRTGQKEEVVTNNPGPGSYNPKGASVYPSSQGCTMGSKHNNAERDRTPGPGAYSSANRGLGNQQGAKIGTSKRQSFNRDTNPGPGTYASSRPFSAGPQYGFTRSEKKIADDVTPGPGQYQIKNFLEDDRARGVTLSSKYDGNHLMGSDTPGPGQYNLAGSSNSARANTPGVKIGTASRNGKYDNSTPGPGQYNGNYRDRNATGVKIGSSQRGLQVGDISTPGPGSYDLNFNRHGQGVSILGHRSSRYGDDNPGPGSYNPNNNAVRERPASAKIGNSKRVGESYHDNPGPGHYTYVDESRKPKFAWTRQLRGEKNRNYNPGPADYEIPTSIPNIPGYIMSSIQSSKGNR